MDTKTKEQINLTKALDEHNYAVSEICDDDCDDSGIYNDHDYYPDYGSDSDKPNIEGTQPDYGDGNGGYYDNTTWYPGIDYGDSEPPEGIQPPTTDVDDGIYDITDTTLPDPETTIPSTTTTIPIPGHPDDCQCDECVMRRFIKWAEENPEEFELWLLAYLAAYYGIPQYSYQVYTSHQSVYSGGSVKRGTSGKYNNEHINLFTGHLTYKHNDIATSGALAAASVAHYYASVACDGSEAADYHCGNGWRLSIHQSVRAFNDEYCKYVYIDAMGKDHYFIETEDRGIIDTSGLNLTLTGDVGKECYITDRKGNVMTFDAKGRLVSVSDSNKNTVRYTYEGDLLTKAIDSFGKELVFIYNDKKLLSEIRDPKNRSVKYTYSAAGELVKITEPDGEVITYTYDSRNHLTAAVSADGVKTVYTYEADSDRIVRTDKYATVASTAHGARTEADVPESGEFTIFEYRGKRSTAVTDRSGIKHVYVFDEYGRCLHEYEDSLVNGTQEKGQVTGTVMHSYANQKRVFESSIVATDSENPGFLVNGTFEHDEPGIKVPDMWNKTGGSNNDRVTSDACIDGTNSFMFAGGVSGSKYLSQKIYITNITENEDPECVESTTSGNLVKWGDTLVFSAWAKAAPVNDGNDTAKLELRAKAEYISGKTEEFSAPYDTEFEGWQYAAVPVRISRTDKLRAVTVYLDCSDNPNAVYFDNARFVNTLANTADYEEYLDETATIFGESVKIVQRVTSHNGIYTTVTESNADYMPVRVTVTDMDKNSFVTVSKYDEKRNLVASQDYRGMVTLNEYTENGQIKRTRSYYSDSFNAAASLVCPEDCFSKEYTYDKNGEYLTAESDPRSEDMRTQYDYADSDGALNYATDKNGVRTSYAYDNNTGAVTMVSASIDGQNNSVAYGYTHRMLTAITHNGFEYLFEYDGFGRQTVITAGGDMLARNAYTLTDTTTVTTTYSNGDSLTVTTDRHQSPISKTYTKADKVTYGDNYGEEYITEICEPGYTETLIENEYDELGKLTKAIDNCSDIVYNYRYNELGNIVEETRGGSVFKSLEYDRHNRLAKTTVHTSDETLVYTPIYETRDSDNAIYADNAIKGMTLNGIFSQSVDKDKYGRPVKASLKAGRDGCELLGTEYGYLKSKNRLTGIVDTVTHKVHGYESGKYKYTYDVNGNITSIASESNSNTVAVREVCNKCGSTIYETEYEHVNGLIAEYEYDGLNRLVRENNYSLGETYTYKYDAAGNILSKSTYDVTSGAVVTPNDVKLYRYASTGWKDKLIVYDGQVVAYDTMGNPWSYRGHTLEWSRIRLLTKWDDIDIEYNASGIRTRKGNTYYELDGSTIISETTYGSTIRYYYGNGGIVGFRYNGNRYYYEKNLMGDIIGIYDESGNKVAGYIYDAWGNCTVQTYGNDARIGEVNPFRYRGYYYDSDIGLYYLKSRYYDAKVGRFINADGIEYLGANGDLAAYNLFLYCANNPVARCDSRGTRYTAALSIDDESDYDRAIACQFQSRVALEECGKIVDITEKLDDFMEKNAETLDSYLKQHGYLESILYFYKNVTDGGELDIKLQDDWKFEDGITYLYRGTGLRYDDPGNINFGYVGAILFPELVLCAGAGVNQISKYGLQFGDITTFYDDPRDNYMVKYGYRLYKGVS